MQGGHMSMNQQVANFGRAVAEISRMFRGDSNAMSGYLSKCIFYSGMGSNDYLNNYFMPTFYSTASQFTTRAFANTLLQDYTRQLTVCISNYLISPFYIPQVCYFLVPYSCSIHFIFVLKV